MTARVTLRFSCVGCGRCCHDLRLPLSVAEAAAWLERGGTVEVLCDAAPAVGDDEPQMRHRAERAVSGVSGTLPIGVAVTLVAAFAGPCPNLRADMLCGAYEVRPDACRIYPAELRQGLMVDPAAKACPSDAWGGERPVFMDEAGVRDPETAAAIARGRAAGLADVAAKARLVALLGIDQAALANEGLVVWRIVPAVLLAALRAVQAGKGVPVQGWAFVSGREQTREMIAGAGAVGILPAMIAELATFVPLY